MSILHQGQFSFLLAILVINVLALVNAKAAAVSAAAVAHDGPSIKDAYKDHFLIGMAGDIPRNYSDQELGLVQDNFNVVTPENCMKPANIHPRADTWRFERADALVNWCEGKHIAVHGHTLVWHAPTGTRSYGTPRPTIGSSTTVTGQPSPNA